MTDDKMQIWNVLGRTDPAHTKPFTRAGGFKGTAIQPIYMTQKMTEMFGPAGQGWGMTEPQFTTVNAGDRVLVFCTAGVWWGERSQIVYGVGGDHAVGVNKNGPVYDDEAFKKAYTDALSNAMKQLGMGADVHMGLYDDSKYVNSLKAEFSGTQGNAVKGPPPTSGPLNKTKAKDMLGAFHAVIMDDGETPDEQALDGHIRDNNDLLKQIGQDWPEWLNGIPGNKDYVGTWDRIERRRAELRQRIDPVAAYGAG